MLLEARNFNIVMLGITNPHLFLFSLFQRTNFDPADKLEGYSWQAVKCTMASVCRSGLVQYLKLLCLVLHLSRPIQCSPPSPVDGQYGMTAISQYGGFYMKRF